MAFKENLYIVNNLALKNNCILIPKKLRPEMLKIIYEDHLETKRCKHLIKDLTFWPNISSDKKYRKLWSMYKVLK